MYAKWVECLLTARTSFIHLWMTHTPWHMLLKKMYALNCIHTLHTLCDLIIHWCSLKMHLIFFCRNSRFFYISSFAWMHFMTISDKFQAWSLLERRQHLTCFLWNKTYNLQWILNSSESCVELFIRLQTDCRITIFTCAIRYNCH